MENFFVFVYTIIIMLNEMHSISQATESLQNNWYFIAAVTQLQFVSSFVFFIMMLLYPNYYYFCI
jgi:hypothetical protein